MMIHCMAVAQLAVLVGSVCAFAEEISPDTTEDQARERRRLELVQRESARLERTNMTRSFRFRVVDTEGNGVAGIPLFVEGLKYRSALNLFSPMQESFDQEIVTGADGYVDCGPLTFGTLHVSVRERGLPDIYDAGLGEHFSLPGAIPLQTADGRPRAAPGVDFIFYLHRYHGPVPLWSVSGEVKHLPMDARSIPWRLTHPLYNYMDADQPAPPEAEGIPPDFEVRFWRDPAIEVLQNETARPGKAMPLYRDGTPRREWVKEANHWIEITSLSGGLVPVDPADGDPRVVREAPLDGYRQRVSWSYDFKAAGIDNGRWPSSPRRFWWRRSTNPPIYGLATFSLGAGIEWIAKRGSMELTARLVINPAPGDRWVERAIQRHPAWITTPHRNAVLAWLTSLGPLVPQPVQEVPPLLPGWPPRP